MSDLGSGARPPGSLDRWVSDIDVATVLGRPADRVELLTHNPNNAVTGGIWRVEAGDAVAVCKVLTDGQDHEGPAWWAASEDPSHWNSWRREAQAYEQDLARWFRPDGIDAPRLLRLDPPSAGHQVLWLEHVAGTRGPDLGVKGLADFALALGRAQARLADSGPEASARDEPWLSRGFLRDYAESKPIDAARLDDDQAWALPRVDRHLGALRDGLRRLHHERATLYRLAALCPRTLCHLDVWPANLAQRDDGTYVLFDWAFCGDGALGEDIANLIPDAIFDLLYPVDVLPDLARQVEAGYLTGLRTGGWAGDERWVRLGIRAAAVKYHWLAERLLAQPDAEDALVYGGRAVSAEALYEARAAGLALLCRWADEARALAAELGL